MLMRRTAAIGRRNPWLLLSPTVAVIAVGVVLLIVALSGVVSSPGSRSEDATCGGQNPAGVVAPVGVTGTVGGLTDEQLSNARTIAGVALAHDTGRLGVRIIVVVAYTESSLVNVGFGDQYLDGSGMTTSRGLFQQKQEWGPLADRMDPAKAATMFLTGGQAGQKGLLDVPQWWTLPPWEAAQAVQQSSFRDPPGLGNFGKNLPTTDAIVDSLLQGQTVPDMPGQSAMDGGGAAAPNGQPAGAASPSPCMPVSGALANTVVANGVDVQIPADLAPELVAPAVAGKVIKAPSEGMARGIAAGFGALGLPYVWGGGGSGGGPDDGCQRGGGDFNSCQGLTGFDCSGLTAYVLKQAGMPNPPGNSGAQRASGVGVPYEQGQPGDIVGFPGHVAVYLGVIDGTPYILEASWVGTPVHIVPLTRSDRDGSLHRLWS